MINSATKIDRLVIRAVKLINPILLSMTFFFAWRSYYTFGTAVKYGWKGEYVLIGLFFITYLYLSHLYHGYWIHINSLSEIIYSQILSAVISDVLIYIIITLLWKRLPSPLPIFAVLLAQIVLICIWAITANKWFYSTHKRKKTIIVWEERPGIDKLIEHYGMNKQFEIIGNYFVEEVKEDFESVLDLAEVVFMCDLHSHDRNQLIKYCIANNKASYVLPRIGDTIMAGAFNTHLLYLPILLVKRDRASAEYLIIKRAFDILLSFAGLVVLSPIMLITAILIKLQDGGDVIYAQERLTKDGKSFNIYKFRSMRMNAEKDVGAVLSTGEKDDRITPIGRFIRKVRIDEMPQLINIIKGDMSIVGPRPERPEISEQYEQILPEFPLRLQMKAGLTGYAQVYGKYNTSPYDKLLLDLMYISRAGIIEDLKIILATLKILVVPESTEGVEEGQTTAMEHNHKERE